MNECVARVDDSIRFDSIRFARDKKTSRRFSPVSLDSTSSRRRARASPASSNRPAAESSRRRHRDRKHTRVQYIAYNSTRIRETTRCLPHRDDASSASSSVYDPHFPPSHVFGHTETVAHDRRPNATRLQIVAARSRSFVRSIARARRSRRRPSLFSVLARLSRRRASTTRKAASSSSRSSRSNDRETERRARET